jgi:hypothetical protein
MHALGFIETWVSLFPNPKYPKPSSITQFAIEDPFQSIQWRVHKAHVCVFPPSPVKLPKTTFTVALNVIRAKGSTRLSPATISPISLSSTTTRKEADPRNINIVNRVDSLSDLNTWLLVLSKS